MKLRHAGTWIAIAWAGLAAAGCILAPEMRAMRLEIERQVPGAEFEHEFSLSLGPTALGLVRGVSSLLPDAHEAHAVLCDLQRVDLSVYRTEALPSVAKLRVPEALRQLLEDDGWTFVARVQEEDEAIWVLTYEEDDIVREIYVMAVNAEELVLARIVGDMDRIVARALEEHPFDIPERISRR